MSDDTKDAERWRKMKAFLRVDVEEREHWETINESSRRRTEERVVEWTWNVDLHPDHSWKFYGSTKDKTKVPNSIDEILDGIELPESAASESKEGK